MAKTNFNKSRLLVSDLYNEAGFRSGFGWRIGIGIALALLCRLATAGQEQYPFDRVFTTAEQRQWLDEQRQGSVRTESMKTQLIAGEAQVDSTRKKNSITFSGLLMGADGKPVYWINGQVVDKPQEPQPHIVSRVTDSSAVSVKYNSETKSMKPGQIWLLEENAVRELYQVRPLPGEHSSSTEDKDDAASSQQTENQEAGTLGAQANGK